MKPQSVARPAGLVCRGERRGEVDMLGSPREVWMGGQARRGEPRATRGARARNGGTERSASGGARGLAGRRGIPGSGTRVAGGAARARRGRSGRERERQL